MSSDYLIFTGPFKELKKYGFKHQYLFGRNYKCWSSYDIGNGRDTRIWAKERRLEVVDLYSRSILLLPWIRSDIVDGMFQLDLKESSLKLYDYDASIQSCREVYIDEETFKELRVLDEKGWIGVKNG